MKTAPEIQADFDRIARVDSDSAWNHNNHYHGYLLRHAPAHCAEALEVGCGTGEFARLLAKRSDRVIGLDLSAEMLRLARERSADAPNIDYLQADVMTYPYPLPAARFDCIATIATLHHMSLPGVLPILKAALKPGGVLLVLDLCKDQELGDFFQSAAAVPLHLVLNRLRNGSRKASPEASAAWDAHGRDETYPTLGEVRRVCADLLPGALVRRHLLWRYSIVWTKA